MRNLLRKKTKFNEIFFAKSALILMLLCVSFLIYINQNAIVFETNGFSKLTKNSLQVYFLDVGQASSTLIVLPNDQTMLIDTGSEESSDKLVKSLRWLLEKNGTGRIDTLVLTHSDADHVGGAPAVLKNFQVASAFRPKLLAREEMDLLVNYDFQIVYTDAYNTAIKALYSQPNCQVDFVDNIHMEIGAELCIDFYAAQSTAVAETNYYSPFIALEYAGKTFMFTGDATPAREKEFLKMLEEKHSEIKVDFLQVAHHGSSFSSTTEFLQKISPDFAFVSSGDDSHPAQQVIMRLKDVGTKEIFVTKNVGTIGVALENSDVMLIKTCSFYMDFPLLIVLLSCLCFYALFLLNGRKKLFNSEKW